MNADHAEALNELNDAVSAAAERAMPRLTLKEVAAELRRIANEMEEP